MFHLIFLALLPNSIFEVEHSEMDFSSNGITFVWKFSIRKVGKITFTKLNSRIIIITKRTFSWLNSFTPPTFVIQSFLWNRFRLLIIDIEIEKNYFFVVFACACLFVGVTVKMLGSDIDPNKEFLDKRKKIATDSFLVLYKDF